ncbi:MAG: TIGR04211 family SH3 domain-containing protein [Arenicella sp.]
MRYLIILLLILPSLLWSQTVWSQTRYITDDFEVMLRTGPGIGNKIVKALPSGTKLTVVIEDAGKGHSQVKTEKGTVGYVLTRFLNTKPASKFRVQYLEKQLTALKAKPEGLQAKLLSLQESYDELSQNYQKNVDQKERVTNELGKIKKASANAVALSEQNAQLEKEVRQLILQMDDLRIQNETMKEQSDKKWFALGATAVLLGMFMGWVLSRFKGRRRSSW